MPYHQPEQLLTFSQVDPSDVYNKAIRNAAIREHFDIVALLMRDPRVQSQLPKPNPTSNDPLARALGIVLEWNAKTKRTLDTYLQRMKSQLVEYQLTRSIMKYHTYGK